MDAESKKRFDEIAATIADVVSITWRENAVTAKMLIMIRARLAKLEDLAGKGEG